jgi:hypothetical protein
VSRWLAGAAAGALHFTMRRPILIVAIFAAILRLLALAQIPLVITNDGVGYATWAQDLLHGNFPDLPVFRTPGYPVALAAAFGLGGEGPWPVLIVQHALGVGACVLLAAGARRLAGPLAGLICGLLAAADLRLLGFECYLLSETLAVFLLVLAVTLALGAGRPTLRCAALGAALAALCLTRPALQVAVPFLAAAALVPLAGAADLPGRPDAHPRRGGLRPTARRLIPAVAALALTFSLIVTPWLIHNARRGIAGLSGASSVFFWLGARKAGLLADTEPPERVRPAWDRLLAGEPPQSDRVYPFLVQSGAWSDAKARKALAQWRRAAIAADPIRYSAALGRSGLWQLDIHPSPPPASDTRWLMRRLGGPPSGSRPEAPNFQFNVEWDSSGDFAMSRRPGAMAKMIGFIAGGTWSGVLNSALAACAATAFALSVLRRRWALALVLTAVGACLAAHIATLLPYSRFGLPMWMSWYLAPAAVWSLWRAPAATSAVGVRPPATAARTPPPDPPAGAVPGRPRAGGRGPG